MAKRIASGLITIAFGVGALCLVGCAATETSSALSVVQVASANTSYTGVKSALSVGKFDNRSSFLRGLFSDGVDRLGGQAKTILLTQRTTETIQALIR